jgi:putative nucleotidyltransferase with HDIG domain
MTTGAAPSAQRSDEVLRRLAAALRAAQLYSPGHPIIGRNLDAWSTAIQSIHQSQPSIVVGLVGDEVIVDDMPLANAEAWGPVIRRLQHNGIERVTIDRGVTADELGMFVAAVASDRGPDPLNHPIGDRRPAVRGREAFSLLAPFPTLPHIRVGRVSTERRITGRQTDMATITRIYSDAASVAGSIWDSAQTEGTPDATMARTMIDGLAQVVAENRTALVALTALKNYDNYTFTHMVNVSILTMGQARALGIDGDRLREFGLAALMHDIGKVRTPLEILNKTDALTDAEFDIIRRHTIDGAEILRRTPDVPTLAPIVAFEHHLRVDGSGYPKGVSRDALNIGTMLCSIADVYDAMRSQRHYQQAFPTDRILAVLKAQDGRQFDQHLIRRFVQLIGIYPAGNAVRLNTGEVAVVLNVHAPDPYRPRVRVVVDSDGERLDLPHDVNLWETTDDPTRPTLVVAPVDSQQYQFDPLAVM